MLAAATSGFVMGGTLIIAVGAQSSFLIEQSMKRQWTTLFVLLFILSDAISISLGAMGFGLLLQEYPLNTKNLKNKSCQPGLFITNMFFILMSKFTFLSSISTTVQRGGY